MRARLLFHRKTRYDDGAIRDMKIWQLPAPGGERPHRLKYSLYYGKDDKRLVGYDNERGKGDHRHYDDQEQPYAFTTVARLLADFDADIRRLRHED